MKDCEGGRVVIMDYSIERGRMKTIAIRPRYLQKQMLMRSKVQ